MFYWVRPPLLHDPLSYGDHEIDAPGVAVCRKIADWFGKNDIRLPIWTSPQTQCCQAATTLWSAGIGQVKVVKNLTSPVKDYQRGVQNHLTDAPGNNQYVYIRHKIFGFMTYEDKSEKNVFGEAEILDLNKPLKYLGIMRSYLEIQENLILVTSSRVLSNFLKFINCQQSLCRDGGTITVTEGDVVKSFEIEP